PACTSFGIQRHVRIELDPVAQGAPQQLLAVTLQQSAINADDQLLGIGRVVDHRGRMAVEYRAIARVADHALRADFDSLFAIDGHLNQGEIFHHVWPDGHGAAIAHATDADAADTPVKNSGIERSMTFNGAQAIFAEDFLAPLASFFQVMGTAKFITRQNGFWRRNRTETQLLHLYDPLQPGQATRLICTILCGPKSSPDHSCYCNR